HCESGGFVVSYIQTSQVLETCEVYLHSDFKWQPKMPFLSINIFISSTINFSVAAKTKGRVPGLVKL
ncbi:hypothetical protein, partial [Salinimicrobium xinjiangense]|uniref:hypothetical protein n=1 Tax=Salinimicrobium xinjiangense TaxID=438596 RepID=UPI0004917C9E